MEKTIAERSLDLHEQLNGKIEVVVRKKIENRDDLSLMYTPGVATPCLKIKDDPQKSFTLTRRNNLVAVITDGSAVLGLGNIGPEASMPVMEGKCALFKEFGDVDAFPICLKSNDVDEIVKTIYLISSSFGGINLEDISAPRCFEIENRLKEICDIPIFHDDQHGTAIVVAAALINAIKVSKKTKGQLKIVINGAGAAGISIAKLLIDMEFGNVILCDRKGIICEGDNNLNPIKEEISHISNLKHEHGFLSDALINADVFIGVSAPNCLNKEMVEKMNNPIIFALANPTPEIMPEEALLAKACIVGTGRSDFPNQINNVLVFPGIFKGALACQATKITENMKHAAAYAIASLIDDKDLNCNNIIPSVFDKDVANVVAQAVINEAIKDGITRKQCVQ